MRETMPLLPEERRWSFRDMLAVNSGLSIATWGFLFGGATGQLVGFVDGVVAMFAGTAIGLGVLFFALLLPVYRTGAESFVFMRSAFGPLGSSVLAGILVLICPIWLAILSNMAGGATEQVLITLAILPTGVSWPVAQTCALGVLVLGCWLAASGSNTVRVVNLAVSPLLVLLSGGLLVAVFWQSGWSAIASAVPPASAYDRDTRLMLAVELNIIAALSWFGLSGNLIRYGRSARGAVWGTWIGLVPVSLLPGVAGLAAALVLGSPDPVQWMTPLVGPVTGLAMLGVLIVANLSSVIGMLQGNVPTLLQHFGARVRALGFAGNIVVFGLLGGLVIVVATDALYARFYTVNAYFGAVLSSAVGVLLADSRVLRGGRLAIRVLHDDAPSGGCGFVRGINPAAMVALGVGFVVYLLLLEPVSQTPAAGFRTLSASLPVIAVAFAIHVLCSRLFTIPRGLGAYADRGGARRGA